MWKSFVENSFRRFSLTTVVLCFAAISCKPKQEEAPQAAATVQSFGLTGSASSGLSFRSERGHTLTSIEELCEAFRDGKLSAKEEHTAKALAHILKLWGETRPASCDEYQAVANGVKSIQVNDLDDPIWPVLLLPNLKKLITEDGKITDITDALKHPTLHTISITHNEWWGHEKPGLDCTPFERSGKTCHISSLKPKLKHTTFTDWCVATHFPDRVTDPKKKVKSAEAVTVRALAKRAREMSGNSVRTCRQIDHFLQKQTELDISQIVALDPLATLNPRLSKLVIRDSLVKQQSPLDWLRNLRSVIIMKNAYDESDYGSLNCSSMKLFLRKLDTCVITRGLVPSHML